MLETQKGSLALSLAHAIKVNQPPFCHQAAARQWRQFRGHAPFCYGQTRTIGARTASRSLNAWQEGVANNPVTEAKEDLPPKALELLVQLQEQVQGTDRRSQGLKSQKAPAAANKAPGLRLKTLNIRRQAF